MKKILVIVLLGLLVGCSFAVFMFSNINEEVYAVISEDKTVTALQIGVYSVYENALKSSESYNGYIHQDKDKYRVYVAIYQDAEIISTLKNYYASQNIDVYLKKFNANNNFLKELNKYEKLLKESGDLETYLSANKNILKLFGESI